jgi:phosphonate transport system permease protein
MTKSGETLPLAPKIDVAYIIKIALVVTFVASFLWSWVKIDMSIFGFFSDFQNVINLFGRMYPPDFAEISTVISAMIETLWIALLGTLGAVLLSYPLALLAASNTTPNRALRAFSRGAITLSRAVPEIILAAIFVVAFGTGPFPGVLALALHSIGMIGRLFADALEKADEAPREALMAVGSTKRQTIRSSLIPQALPSMIATALFRFEINLRGSAVLGLVGAGGIGTIISESLETIQYRPALAAVTVLFVVILLTELASNAIRQSLIGTAANIGLQSQHTRLWARLKQRRDTRVLNDSLERRSIVQPWTSERLFRLGSMLLVTLLILIAFATVDINWFQTLGNIDRVQIVLKQMVPPSFAGERSMLISGLIESVAISIVATTLGVMVALPVGVLMARNLNVRKWFSTLMRIIVLAVRGIPELIIAVIFVSAMGLGPVSGTLAMSIAVMVFGGKLFADSLEEVSAAPREALVSVGASRSQEFVSAVIPQFVPSFIAHLFYMFDVFFRSSTILGIVGGGGIGFLLISSIRVYEFQLTLTIIISVFAIVLVIEFLGLMIKRLYR